MKKFEQEDVINIIHCFADSSWVMVLKTDNPQADASVPFSSLKSKTAYTFRVRAINKNGVSPPSAASEQYTTPGKLLSFFTMGNKPLALRLAFVFW